MSSILLVAIGAGVDSSDPEVINDPKHDANNEVEDDSNDNGHRGVRASLL